MSRMTLDGALSQQLNRLTRPVELCDPSGRVLGRFIPKMDLSGWDPLTPEVSEEELERRANSDEKRYTTAEMLVYLEKLPCSGSNGSNPP